MSVPRHGPMSGILSRMPSTSLCPRCGSTFEQRSGVGRRRKYCSPTCHYTDKTCPICEVTFRGYPRQKYCSDECRFEAMSRRNRADPAEQRRRNLLGRERLQAALHERHSGNGYRKVDGRHEHRVVAEAVLQRPLAPGEVVHHEDLDKLNNFPTNLIVFPTQTQHARHHAQGHPGKGPCDCPGIRLGDLL